MCRTPLRRATWLLARRMSRAPHIHLSQPPHLQRASTRAAVLHSAACAAQAPHYCMFHRSLAAFSQFMTEVCLLVLDLTTLAPTSSRRAAADAASPINLLRRHEIGCDAISLHAAYRPLPAEPTRSCSSSCSDAVCLQCYSSSRSSSACGARFRSLEHCSSQRGSIFACGHIAAERWTRFLRWWLWYVFVVFV